MNTDKKIIQAIAEHLGLLSDDLDSQSLLREDLGLGPVELNDLLHDLSAKFDVIFDAEDTEHLQKVEDLIVLVEDNLIE